MFISWCVCFPFHEQVAAAEHMRACVRASVDTNQAPGAEALSKHYVVNLQTSGTFLSHNARTSTKPQRCAKLPGKNAVNGCSTVAANTAKASATDKLRCCELCPRIALCKCSPQVLLAQVATRRRSAQVCILRKLGTSLCEQVL